MLLSRRTLLLGAAAGLGTSATGALGYPAAAGADTGGIPTTLARVLTAAGPTTTDRTEFPLTHLSVAWPAGSGAAPRVRLRSPDGWQPWKVVTTGCCAGSDRSAGSPNGALLSANGAVGYEIDLPYVAVRLGEINVVDGVLRPALAILQDVLTLAGQSLGIGYRSRAAWGADEDLRFAPDGTESFPPEYFPVQTITVHHTASLPNPDPASTVRGIYHDHTVVREFGDIGYHLLIDQHGVVYEGRWSGEDKVPVFGSEVGSDGRPQMNNAAHVAGFNAGNVGIALLGDFTAEPPTGAAVDSLVRVLRVLSAVCRLDPKGTTDYVNPISGATATVDTICGHRDWSSTECPGDKLYPMLPAIRQRVAVASPLGL
jgi:hypothetical protein